MCRVNRVERLRHLLVGRGNPSKLLSGFGLLAPRRNRAHFFGSLAVAPSLVRFLAHTHPPSPIPVISRQFGLQSVQVDNVLGEQLLKLLKELLRRSRVMTITFENGCPFSLLPNMIPALRDVALSLFEVILKKRAAVHPRKPNTRNAEPPSASVQS